VLPGPLVTELPAASVAPVVSEPGRTDSTHGKSRTSRGWKFPPLSGLSLTSISLDSPFTSIRVSAAPTSSRGSKAVTRFAPTLIPLRPKSRLGDLKLVNTEAHGVEMINPASLLSVDSLTPVSTPIKLTQAPATVAPDWSNTVPVTVPGLVRACAARVSIRIAASKFAIPGVFMFARPVLGPRREEPIRS